MQKEVLRILGTKSMGIKHLLYLLRPIEHVRGLKNDTLYYNIKLF